MDLLLLIGALGALTFALFLTVIVFVIYSGLFYYIDIGTGKPPVKDLRVAYKFGRGPYKNSGDIFNELAAIAPKQRCLGIYYDDPNQVESSKLRYVVAAILAEGEEVMDKDLLEACRKEGFKLFSLPEVSHTVRTSFPYKTFLSMYIAIFRVYPKLGAYVKEFKLCAHPFMEMYQDGLIHFVAPLAKQDEFYVPETEDDYVEEADDQDKEVEFPTLAEQLKKVPEFDSDSSGDSPAPKVASVVTVVGKESGKKEEGSKAGEKPSDSEVGQGEGAVPGKSEGREAGRQEPGPSGDGVSSKVPPPSQTKPAEATTSSTPASLTLPTPGSTATQEPPKPQPASEASDDLPSPDSPSFEKLSPTAPLGEISDSSSDAEPFELIKREDVK